MTAPWRDFEDKDTTPASRAERITGAVALVVILCLLYLLASGQWT